MLQNITFTLLLAFALPLLCSLNEVEVVQIELINCSQSSTHEGAHCGRATDGNPDGNYPGGSCTHTNTERGWWKARTHHLTYFKDIRIYNRLDCCSDRLNDFSIKIDGHECVRYQSNQHFTDRAFSCNRAGQEIQIFQHQMNPLTLCEVQVFGHLMSTKQLKLHSCSQSTTDHNGVCGRAIEGNKDQNYDHGSCTHTGYAANEWWEARTERNALVTLIRIYNRQDCCSERLNDFTILVGNQACVSHKSGSAFSDMTFECNAVGQVIRVRNNMAGALTICELEAFGELR